VSGGARRAAAWSPRERPEAPAEAVVICLPKPLAGKGTARQLAQAWAGLRPRVEGAGGVEVHYVGPPLHGVEIDEVPAPLATVRSAADVSDTYRHVSYAMRQALGLLAERGLRRVAVVAMGYTAFGPEAVHRAVAELAAGGAGMSVTVLLVDSAYPDTDGESESLDAGGWPVSRFHAPAYRSSDRVRTVFLLTSAYRYDPAIVDPRAPRGMEGVAVIAPPYPDAYVERVTRLGARARAAAAPGDLIVPLVSSDIWSPESVGAWMTAEQYETVTAGTRAVLTALVHVARRRNRRIRVPLDTAAAAFVAREPIAGVALDGSAGAGEPVLLRPYRDLSQDEHTRLLASADLAVSRTAGQANATVVLALARTPNLVIDMPARGYMQSERTSLAFTHDVGIDERGELVATPRARPLGWRAEWSWPSDRMAGLIGEILDDAGERDRRTSAAAEAFHALRAAPDGSLFAALAGNAALRA
jgi:hypothetical protein